jgi:O-acetyl-ADP-ribose deacetylase (regulator of RNase III)
MYKIELRQGDLLLDTVANIMLNPSNTSLLLGSGVSMAFKRKFGIQLQQKMNLKKQSLCNISLGDIVITKEESNNPKYIYHAIVMNYTGIGSKYPTLKTIEMIIDNIKLQLNKLDLDAISIAIPFIGCGVGGLNIADVTKIYIEKFSESTTKDITIRLYGYSRDDCMVAYKELNPTY